jgi:hypothetical protein
MTELDLSWSHLISVSGSADAWRMHRMSVSPLAGKHGREWQGVAFGARQAPPGGSVEPVDAGEGLAGPRHGQLAEQPYHSVRRAATTNKPDDEASTQGATRRPRVQAEVTRWIRQRVGR